MTERLICQLCRKLITRRRHSLIIAALAHLRQMASSRNITPSQSRGIEFVFVERRSEGTYPCRQEYFVAAPAVVEEKARYGLPWFEAKWSSVQMRLGFHV